MKTFLKILLVVALLFVAIKLSPLIFMATLAALVVAAMLGVVGLSVLAVFFALLLVLATVLAPIWVPVLIIVGLMSLVKKSGGRSAPPVMAV